MAEVLLGLGGNLGDPLATIRTALDRLRDAGIVPLAVSSFYRTEPWGGTAQPDFVNLCAFAATTQSPQGLLAATQAIERDLGRTAGERWGPRVVDIDILAYEDVAVTTPELLVPHPRITERAFVLVPLAEIAPDLVVDGRRVADWAWLVDRSGVDRIGPGPEIFTTST